MAAAALLAEAHSCDLGLTATGPEPDNVQLPLPTEAAAQALARAETGGPVMNRRGTPSDSPSAPR